MSDLERRLKRIVQVVILLGIAGGIASMFPTSFRPAYGVPMLLAIGATAIFGGFLYFSPRRGVAIAWVAWTTLAIFTFIGMTWDEHFLAQANLFPMTVGEVLIGAMLLLIAIVNPIVVLASSTDPAEVKPTSARLVSR